MATERSRPRRAAGVLGSDLGGEYVVRAEPGGRVHVLNASAREVYLLCDGSRDHDGIARALAETFDVPLDRALRDVNEAVAEMMGLGLLIEG